MIPNSNPPKRTPTGTAEDCVGDVLLEWSGGFLGLWDSFGPPRMTMTQRMSKAPPKQRREGGSYTRHENRVVSKNRDERVCPPRIHDGPLRGVSANPR
jgi:hypothetical protein